MDITGKVAVVTGAASGIGRASALALAAAGAAVGVADVDADGGGETVRQIEAAGGRAMFVRTDVRDVASVSRLFDDVSASYGGIDIVHNNAGIVSGNPPWPDTPPDRILDVLNINLGGVMLGTRCAIDHLRKRGGGVIVNTASIAAQFPMADDAVYSATKAGVVMFTQACGALFERENIRVNAVLPGMVDTPIINKTGDGEQPAEGLVPMLDLVPAIKPETVASVVLGLITDDKAFSQTPAVLADA